jgi:uncharacterized protein YkwD
MGQRRADRLVGLGPAAARHLVAALALACATLVPAAGPAPAAPTPLAGPMRSVTSPPSATEDFFAERINDARRGRGLPRFRVRADLAQVARAQARRMAERNRLYHNPNLTREVSNWRWVGENVGYGPGPAVLHRAFMNSAPHRANILDGDFTQVGVGAVVRDGRLWVAEVFRQPAGG